MTNTKTMTAVLCSALLLAACTEPKLSNADLNSLSCTDLAREIGKFGQIEKDAKADNLKGTIDLIVSDDEGDQIVAGAETISSEVVRADAEKEYARLESAFIRRGCR